jgi:protein involved in polysaccharide export with SLBB domain
MKRLMFVGIAAVLFAACSNPVSHIPELQRSSFVPASKIPGALPTGAYKLIPYDQINIRFPFHPEQDPKAVAIPVQPDGNIFLDGTGAIQAAGLSPEELAQVIVQKSADRLRDPQVVVTVAQYAPRRVFVGGEVKSPGTVIIQDGMTPLQAIFDRGGFTDVAQKDSVILIRDAASNDPQIGRMNLTEALENGSAERVLLTANDVIYVPMTGVGRSILWVRQNIRDLVPWDLMRPPSIGQFIR